MNHGRSASLPTKAYMHSEASIVSCEHWVYKNPRELVFREDVEDLLAKASELVAQVLIDVEDIANANPKRHADHWKIVEGCRANFERGNFETRPYTLKDAKPRARCAVSKLRELWALIDPPLTTS